MGLLRRWSMVFLAAVALPAQAADPEYYGGILFGVAEYSEWGYAFNMSTFTGRLGYQMTKSLAVEARAGFGGSGKSNGATYELDGLGSLLAKLSWKPMSDSEAYLHLLAGASAARTTSTVPGTTQGKNLYGGSIGLGVDLFADRDRALNIEWIQYVHGKLEGSNTTYNLTQFGIGYLQRF